MKSVKKSRRSQFQDLSQPEQVRRAMPIARSLVLNLRGDEAKTIIDHVASIANDPALLRKWKEAAVENVHNAMWNRLEAAQALGIAIGLMLRPETLLKGRA